MSSPFVHDTRFDGLYLNVADTTKGIEPLLDTVFSFLRRKTDFFDGPPGSNNGPQDAIKKVNEVVQRHVDLYLESRKKSTTTTKKKTSTTEKKKKEEKKEGEDIIEMSQDGGFDISSAPKSTTTPICTESDGQKVEAQQVPEHDKKDDTKETSDENDKIKAKDDKDNDEKPPPPVGNGGAVDGKYVWTQTLSEVIVNIPVPEHTRGKDLNIVMSRTHLKVALKKDKTTLVDAPLCKPIVVDDSMWTVEDQKYVVINLQKVNTMEWWNCVCQGDPTINVQAIQPENSSLGDLDGETRKTVEKMMFDQRQKAMGQPTSDEQQKLDMLEKFKQQHPELDFSNAKFS